MTNPSPTLLAFDTSAAYCSAALLLGGNIVAARYEELARGQAERLFPMLDEVLKEAGVGWDALDAIGVGTGPGNFTGIRISVSAARGLALSLRVPAIGVTLFDALAENAPASPLLLTLSAPRDQIHISHGNTGISVVETVTLDTLPACEPDTVVIGNRSAEIAKHLGCAFAPAAYAPAAAIAHVAAKRWETDTDRPVPYYLRPADAAPASDPPPVILP